MKAHYTITAPVPEAELVLRLTSDELRTLRDIISRLGCQRDQERRLSRELLPELNTALMEIQDDYMLY